MNTHTTDHAQRPVVSNGHTPAAQLLLIVALIVTLTVSGCVGLTSAGTPAAKSSSTNTSSGALAASATTMSFGSVAAGSSSSQTLTLTNSGTAAIMISQATVSGAGFSIVGGTSSISIAAGQNYAFQVQFAPQTPGSVTGSLVVASNASNSTLSVSLNGAGMASLSITTQPASQSVAVGQTATFTVAATGTATLTYQWMKNAIAISGATSASYTTPATTTSNNGTQFTVTVTNSTGSVTSNAATLTVNAATLLLNSSATSLSFGNVNIGSISIMGVTFTNTGNSSVTVSNVSISGAGFSASGVSTGQILTPGQTATLNVTFTPATAASVTGTVTLTSNATNSPATIPLSGTGVQPVSHSVTLSWVASTSVVAGYNVYRSGVTGGLYTKLNSTLITTTQYTDSTVQAGQTYFYVVTSVDSSNVESAFSNEVSATVPTP